MSEPDLPRLRSPGPGGTPWSEWVERFGVYFLGVAIGLVLVGMLWQARAREVQSRQAPAQAPLQTPP